MATTDITFVSKTVAGTRTVSLGTYPVLKEFSGQPEMDMRRSISKGGKAVSVVHDAWHEYRVMTHPINIVNDDNLYSNITAWLSHALGGGEFAFILNSDEDESSTLSAQEAAGQTVLSVTSTTGFAAGDWVFIEDADDPTVFQRVKITTVDSGVQVTIDESLKHTFASGSLFRHADYFPSCVLLKHSFMERKAGKGSNLWDLKFTFRTVR